MKITDSIKLIFNSLGLAVNKLSTFTNIQSARIGNESAAEVFSSYIRNYIGFEEDSEVKGFLDFYINNWKLSSSQWSQDIFVMYATKKRKYGKYLEIGGADGFTHSNTFSLNKHLNWKGLLLEPDKDMFSTLKKVRFTDQTLNCAISPSGEEKSFNLKKIGQLSALEGYEGKDMHSKIRESSNRKQQTKGISLTKLLSSNEFDYFSLDVEGAELPILKSVNWEIVKKPLLITVEYNFREEDRIQIVSILESVGYKNCFEKFHWIRRGDLWFKLQID